MTTGFKKSDEEVARTNKVVPISTRSGNGNAKAGGEHTSNQPGRLLRFPGSRRLDAVNGDSEKTHRYPGLTRSQKVQRIVNRVFSDDLAEDKLEAILSEIEEISVRAN